MSERQDYEFTIKIRASREDADMVVEATENGIASLLTGLHDNKQDHAIEVSASKLRERVWESMETVPLDRWIILDWDGQSVPAKWLDNSKTSCPWKGWKPPSMWYPWPDGEPTGWQDFPKPTAVSE